MKHFFVFFLLLITIPYHLLFANSNFAVSYCPCKGYCYTDEVTNISCNHNFVSFDSYGLPDKTHTMMVGISATNQQIPLSQDFTYQANNQIRIPLFFNESNYHIDTDSGAIGVAVNGVPLFDPSTQGAIHPNSGKRPHTLDEGELDFCGGHAGRGDDYHYHIAPKCLIDELGEQYIEVDKGPIGYAKDGAPIHAIGWFNKKNNIENRLDHCRGMRDSNGLYFYNVKPTYKWDIINCFKGEPQNIGPKPIKSIRKDRYGNGMNGLIPIKYKVTNFKSKYYKNDICYFLEGYASNLNLVSMSGSIMRNYSKQGNIFFCNSKCYGYFKEFRKQSRDGRIVEYELETTACPKELNLNNIQLFND